MVYWRATSKQLLRKGKYILYGVDNGGGGWTYVPPDAANRSTMQVVDGGWRGVEQLAAPLTSTAAFLGTPPDKNRLRPDIRYHLAGEVEGCCEGGNSASGGGSARGG